MVTWWPLVCQTHWYAMNKERMGRLRFLLAAVLVLALCTASGWAVSTGPGGILIPQVQPDGSAIRIRVIGDEFERKTLSEDGRPVVRDEAMGAWVYASIEAGTLKKTALVVGKDDPSSLKFSAADAPMQQFMDHRAVISGSGRGRASLLRGIKAIGKNGNVTPEETAEIIRRVALHNERYGAHWPLLSLDTVLQSKTLQSNGPDLFPPAQPTTGARLALCVLVAFSDDPATPAFSQAQIDQMFNSDTPTFANSGSIKKYYTDQSNGQLVMTTVVTRYVRLSQTRSYYDLLADDMGPSRIIDEAIASLATTDPTLFTANTFSTYQEQGDTVISSFSMFYPGNPSNNGLWPHSWWYNGGGTVKSVGNGMYIGNYQISSLLFDTTEPVIGVACHEIGHMLCDFSDYYDYGSATRYSCGDSLKSAGIGNHCLMASSANEATPTPINPYLKWKAGWATVTDLSQWGNISIQTSDTAYYRFLKSGSTKEYFILENRLKSASVWNTYLPDEGLAIWHVDENVLTCNELQQRTSAQHYELSLEQADGLYNLENSRPDSTNYGDATDYYDGAAGRNSFSPSTTPNSAWWDGSSNGGMTLSSISAPGTTMTFVFGDVNDPTDFSAVPVSSSQINLSWGKNPSNDNVMVAWNTTAVFGTPNGTYPVGGTISGGGTVLYNGSATAVSHSGLTTGTKYFYKAWSVRSGPNYSIGAACSATTVYSVPFTEGFENAGSIPNGWAQEYVTGTLNWMFQRGGGYANTHPASAHGGLYNALLYIDDYTGPKTKLVTPMINFGAFTQNAQLTFWHYMELWFPDQDELRVYYKTSASGTWTLLTTYTTSVASWTQRTISLPNPNSTYFIAFEGNAKYGYGVCIDDVSITAAAVGGGPTWWYTRNVTDNAASTNDYAAANQGQVKWIATQAYLEMQGTLSGGAGATVSNLVAGFSASNNYQSVNVGQVKATAKPFYDRIRELHPEIPYPWTTNTVADDEDYGAANVGQVKNAFSFPIEN